MKRLLWVGVGAAGALRALRAVREVGDRHVPAGARTALGAAAGAGSLVQRAVAAFRAGTAEREAELRADLLAGADLTRSRARVDAWRAERARARHGAHDDVPAGRGPGPHGPAPSGTARPGSAAASARRPGTGAHRAEDPDDGSLGYSFF